MLLKGFAMTEKVTFFSEKPNSKKMGNGVLGGIILFFLVFSTKMHGTNSKLNL